MYVEKMDKEVIEYCEYIDAIHKKKKWYVFMMIYYV